MTTRPVVEKGGRLGKLRILHNLQNNDYTFIIEDAGTQHSYAIFEKGEAEWIARTLAQYIHGVEYKEKEE